MVAVMPVGKDEFEARLEEVRSQVSDPVAGLFGPGSMMWEVLKHSQVYLLGTTQAAFLDVAHPWVATAVMEHSKILSNPTLRAQKTYAGLTTVIFGDLDSVMRVSRGLYALHNRITGTVRADGGAFPDRSPYLANEVNALLWVHLSALYVRLNLYEVLVRPLSIEEKDRFIAESAQYAGCFGIPAQLLPADHAAFLRHIDDTVASGQLAPSEPSRELMAFLTKQIPAPARPHLLAFNSVMLPPATREILGLPADSPTTRRRYRTMLAAQRAARRTLPGALREIPPYREAVARIEGREPDRITRVLGPKLSGQRVRRAPVKHPA